MALKRSAIHFHVEWPRLVSLTFNYRLCFGLWLYVKSVALCVAAWSCVWICSRVAGLGFNLRFLSHSFCSLCSWLNKPNSAWVAFVVLKCSSSYFLWQHTVHAACCCCWLFCWASVAAFEAVYLEVTCLEAWRTCVAVTFSNAFFCFIWMTLLDIECDIGYKKMVLDFLVNWI